MHEPGPDASSPDAAHARRSGWKRVALQLGLGLGALAVFVWRVDLGAVFAQLGRIDVRWAALALIVFTGSKFVHGWRWWSFLGRPEVPQLPLIGVFLMSNMANSLLPLRAGDLLRVEVPNHRWGVPRSTLASSVFVVESVLDLFAFAVLMMVVVWYAPLPPVLGQLVVFVSVAAVLLFTVMVVLARTRGLTRWVARLVRPLPERIGSAIQSIVPPFVDGMASLRTNRDAVRAVLISVFAWLVEVAFYWMMAEAFALELDLHQAMVLMIAANLIVSLPLTPWSVGPYELAVTEALVAIGADRVNAGAFALGSHLMLQAWILITGSAAMLALRLGPRDLWPGRHAKTEAAARVEGGSRAEGG